MESLGEEASCDDAVSLATTIGRACCCCCCFVACICVVQLESTFKFSALTMPAGLTAGERAGCGLSALASLLDGTPPSNLASSESSFSLSDIFPLVCISNAGIFTTGATGLEADLVATGCSLLRLGILKLDRDFFSPPASPGKLADLLAFSPLLFTSGDSTIE